MKWWMVPCGKKREFLFPAKSTDCGKKHVFLFPAIAEKNIRYVFCNTGYMCGKKREFLFFSSGEKNTIYKYINFPPQRVVTGVGKDGLTLSPPVPFPLPVTRQHKDKGQMNPYVKILVR